MVEFIDFMQSREDYKHMNLNELYESDIFELIDSQFRIMKKQELEQKEQEQSSIIDNFDML